MNTLPDVASVSEPEVFGICCIAWAKASMTFCLMTSWYSIAIGDEAKMMVSSTWRVKKWRAYSLPSKNAAVICKPRHGGEKVAPGLKYFYAPPRFQAEPGQHELEPPSNAPKLSRNCPG